MVASAVTAWFSSPVVGVAERIEVGPAATNDLAMDILSMDAHPTTTRTVIINSPPEDVRPGIGVKLFHSGGGMQTISIPFLARRFSRGDAENYLYNVLVALGRTDLGELCVHEIAYKDCWFIGGDGSVQDGWQTDPDDADAYIPCFAVQGRLRFVRSLPSGLSFTNPISILPNERTEFVGGSNIGDYTATLSDLTEVKLGRYCDLISVSVERPVTYAKIPRATGVVIKGRGHPTRPTQLDYRRGRQITLEFRGHLWANQDNDGTFVSVPVTHAEVTNDSRAVLERRIQEMHLGVRDEIVTLAGNGNTFYECMLANLTPDDDTETYSCSSFNATFQQSYNEVAAL